MQKQNIDDIVIMVDNETHKVLAIYEPHPEKLDEIKPPFNIFPLMALSVIKICSIPFKPYSIGNNFSSNVSWYIY
jgi:hypothetical protein